jgi:hypothetical protein
LVIVAVIVASVAVSAWQEHNRADTPEACAALCACLFDEMLVSGADNLKPTDEEVAVMIPKLLDRLHHLSSSTRDIAPIASAYAR